MTYLLDTNVVSELRKRRGNYGVKLWVAKQSVGDLAIGVVTVIEIDTAILRKGRSDSDQARILTRWFGQNVLTGFAGRVPAQGCLHRRARSGPRVSLPQLGRAEIVAAFTRLGERLVRWHVIGELYVIGGAAMALAYDAERVTRDIDATFVPHRVVLDAAREVAAELGLPAWWLNDQASAYVSPTPDSGQRAVFNHPGLRVSVILPRHLLAMKVLAARRYADTADARGITS